MQHHGKTILMSIFDGNMARNILRTDVLGTLAADTDIARIVLLVHPLKREEYEREFKKGKVEIDVYPSSIPSRVELASWFLVRHAIHTKNVRAKINELFFTSKGSMPLRFAKYVVALCAFYATHVRFMDVLVRAWAKSACNGEMFDEILRRHNPDLVFLPTIFGTNDIRLLKKATSLGMPTVGMIKSWDNLIGKDPLLFWPDRLIVHNTLVKDLAMNMHRYPSDRIFISGIPQMDVYAHKEVAPTREAFFAKHGLDPNRRLVVYAAVGKLISYHEPEVIPYLATLIAGDRIAPDLQLLVRLHPAYPSDENIFHALPHTVVVRPGKIGVERNPLRFDFEFDAEETHDLMATLMYADVLIQSGSTMAIDAACFDTPIISFGYDGPVIHERIERSAHRLLIKDHFKRILETGGTRAVYSEAEFIEAMHEYLAAPDTDRAGRERIVSEQCFMLDGRSGQRIGAYLSECLERGVARTEE